MTDIPPYRPDDYADPTAPSPRRHAQAPYGQSPNPQPVSYDHQPPNSQQPPYGQPQHYGTPSAYGPPTPYGPPGSYGAAAPYGPPPQYGHYARAEHPQTQLVFILGIVGIFTGLVSFIAWYLGSQAKKEIQAGAPFPWSGNLKTGYLLGKVFGIIYIVLFGLGAVFWVLYILLILGLFMTL